MVSNAVSPLAEAATPLVASLTVVSNAVISVALVEMSPSLSVTRITNAPTAFAVPVMALPCVVTVADTVSIFP